MGLPNVTDNYKGYEEGDLSKYVEQLKDKQFLLVCTFFYTYFCVALKFLIKLSEKECQKNKNFNKK